MKLISRLIPWKTTLLLSLSILMILNIFSFYGLYTGTFYFFKLENYLFPMLSIIHIIYLYAVWFKVKEDEIPDIPMRNLEYGLYAIFLVYTYKTFDSVWTIVDLSTYKNYSLPESFLPLGSLIAALYILLLLLTLLTFLHRRKTIGKYDFNNPYNWQ